MDVGVILTVALGVVVVSAALFFVYRHIPKRHKTKKNVISWKQIQAGLGDSANWPEALKQADHLLNSVLKRRRFKGTSMGERMVAAQKKISNNDAMWFAHNLHKKVQADPDFKLKEADMKTALIGYRGALKDLGALPVAKQPAPEDDGEQKS